MRAKDAALVKARGATSGIPPNQSPAGDCRHRLKSPCQTRIPPPQPQAPPTTGDCRRGRVPASPRGATRERGGTCQGSGGHRGAHCGAPGSFPIYLRANLRTTTSQRCAAVLVFKDHRLCVSLNSRRESRESNCARTPSSCRRSHSTLWRPCRVGVRVAAAAAGGISRAVAFQQRGAGNFPCTDPLSCIGLLSNFCV